MEKCAEKAKITSPSVGKGFSLNKWKLLMISATIVYTIAFFSPWIWERYSFIIITRELQPEIYPYPPVPREGWFWSFQAIIYTARNDYRVLLLWDYWLNVNGMRYHREFCGWLGILAFQILTIVMALVIIRRKNADKRLGTVVTAFSSIIAPILCIYQRCIQLSYGVDNSQFFIGFWLAVVSTILFCVSYWFVKTQNKILSR
jgi:hypothetical protein